MRKIEHIQTQSQAFHDANKQFYKRQENILLNALQFINDVAEKEDDDDNLLLPSEVTQGADEGYVCKLDKE